MFLFGFNQKFFKTGYFSFSWVLIEENEENDDEEISIDLGKITNFFKRKKKEEEKRDVGVKASHQESESKESGIKEQEKEEPKRAEKAEEKKESEEIKSDDEDEIAIDFGKIKSFFSGKKKKEESVVEKREEEEGEKDEDDEISLDFKKIKNVFKFSKDEKEESEEEMHVDWRQITKFISKHKILLLVLIPLLISVFLRVQPAYLPITDDWARNTVSNSIRSQVSGQINQQYPNLPDANKNVLIDNEVQKFINENKAQIDAQIQATSQQFKSRLKDDSGQTYLLAIDPYFWMRHAKNIIENGHPGDEIRDGVPWDNHMYAPDGRRVPLDMFHAYFEVFMFKAVRIFNRDVELMSVIFFIPVIISALSVIPAFFIARKMGGNMGGFIAAMFVAIHPSFLTRTVGGFSDTDAYNVMFPLFISWFFLEALESKTRNKTILLSALSAFLIGLYSFTWGGWWYIFDFVLISTIFYIAYYSFVHKKELLRGLRSFIKQRAIKNSLIFVVIFVVLSGVFVTLFTGFGRFQNFYNNPLGFARLKEVGITTVWPNVFTTVAEQNPASLSSVISQIGFGKTFFLLIALVGVALTLAGKGKINLWFVSGTIIWYSIVFFMKIQNLNTFLILISIPIIIRLFIALYRSETEIDIKYSIFLILWFLATIYASTKGIRFMLLLVPVFAIGFGIALGEFFRHASKWVIDSFHVHKYIAMSAMGLTVLLVAGAVPVPWPPFCILSSCDSAMNIARNEIPSMNDAWWSSLTKIKEDSKPDAIINSWWDFGHWFKFVADRAVTFDGTSQNTPQAHWIGNSLLTSDEKTSIGILRMLDCGGTRAYDAVLEITEDPAIAIDIIYEIIPETEEKAGEILGKYVDDDGKIDEILGFTHCQPSEDYFITSEDMIGKSGVWAHFGSWDFDRALIYNTLKKKEFSEDIEKSSEFLQERFNFTKNEADNLFFEVQGITNSQQANNWIAPWPGYAGTNGCRKVDDETLSCDNGLIFNLTTYEAFGNAQQGVVHPKFVSFPTNEGIILKEYNESLIAISGGRNLGVALIKNGDNYQALQMDSDLTASMFTRLFYQEGIGLRYFKKFSDERSVFGGRIIVWKVDWEGNETNIIEVPEIVEETLLEDPIVESSPGEIEEENVSNTSQEINELEVEGEQNISETNTTINNSLNNNSNSSEYK